MEVHITARHFRPSSRLRAHIDEKFGRLERFASRTQQDMHVIVTAEKKLHRVEAKLGRILIKHEAPDVMEAIERASDRMAERLRKDHAKRREHKGRMGLRDGANGKVTPRRVAAITRVRRESHSAAEIDVDEAAKKLTRSRKEILVFVSKETGQVNVLYRRRDGRLGLIEPETAEG